MIGTGVSPDVDSLCGPYPCFTHPLRKVPVLDPMTEENPGMTWADWVVWAMAHPDLYPPLRAGEVKGRPDPEHLLRMYAHRPEMGRRAVVFLEARGLGPTGATPVDPAEEGPSLTEVDRGRRGAARAIAARGELTLSQALRVVEVHGVNVHPSRARRLWRRMVEDEERDR